MHPLNQPSYTLAISRNAAWSSELHLGPAPADATSAYACGTVLLINQHPLVAF